MVNRVLLVKNKTMNTKLDLIGIFAFVLMCQFPHSCGVDIDFVYEGECVIPPTVKDLDIKFLISNKLYAPMESKLDMYLFSEDLLRKKAKDITEEELQAACITSKIEGDMVVSTGFGGKILKQKAWPGKDGSREWKSVADSESNWKFHTGRSYSTLTDNQSYLISINYYDEAGKTWSVASTSPRLSPEIKAKILEHLQGFGFDTEKVHEIKYEHCEGEKDEL